VLYKSGPERGLEPRGDSNSNHTIDNVREWKLNLLYRKFISRIYIANLSAQEPGPECGPNFISIFTDTKYINRLGSHCTFSVYHETFKVRGSFGQSVNQKHQSNVSTYWISDIRGMGPNPHLVVSVAKITDRPCDPVLALIRRVCA